MNNKIFKIIIIIITLFAISLNTYALDVDSYITEYQEQKEKSQEQNQSEVNNETLDEKIGNYNLIIEDDANLLTPEEQQKLKEKMKPLTKYGHIGFKTISTNTQTTKLFADNYYYEKFKNESGVVFIIDMDNRYIYIVANGEIYKTITKRKSEIITDNVYQYASKKEYYECAYNAFNQVEALLENKKIAEPMRHASNIVVSIVLAFFINFLIVLNASKIKKALNKEVLDNCDITFEASNVEGIKTGTHKVYSPVSESSSSSGGGHSSGGGGGGFSGGGGGHRF